MKNEICNAMTEEEMREAEVPYFTSVGKLMDYIESLVNRTHTYDTCVYAMSMAAVAAFNYVASKLGTTVFQGSCADLDILRRTRRMKHGFRIIDYEKLLYPQYLNKDEFPSFQDLISKNIDWLADAAKELLKETSETNSFVHPDVCNWWKELVEKKRIKEENNVTIR